ncbi:N-lysine methyltransferase KMT5A-like [Melanotaenia boesemani]|uniref:N-lysine methyltransferase KMT5A-like n=1 Tax=Melanotaenia boesemani TaxID=1250792 RepID=UPI001C053119|nr:N-lysine methyltransferase KMT5A-like [Melanotaenia boesemani]
MSKWSPPEKEEVESSVSLMKLVRTQKWKHLAVVEPSPWAGEGKGVVTTKRFPKNSILCDYHGELITGAEGRRRMANRSSDTDYSFFFKAGSKELCVDAHNVPCSCHPHMETFGRIINHSKWDTNVRPEICLMQFPEGSQHVIFFRAMTDLEVNEELLF